MSPAKLGDTPYNDLVDAMKQHVDPTPSVTVQRFKFNSCVHLAEETVSTYVSELRSIAEHCNFGKSLDDMLRDHLICGINEELTQHCLLAESKLTLKRALKITQSLETAVQMVKLYRDNRLSSVELLFMTSVSLPVLKCVFAVERAAIH